uniref:RNA transcription, translation and transport factor protein n=1 Tax=Canis lupus familiaris TaxID=9615 RepID=A0A8C0PF59_CANLF
MALYHHNLAGFNCKDETEFRNFIVWLEDQKIRHYKIVDRGNLRNIHSSDWPKFFEKYLRDNPRKLIMFSRFTIVFFFSFF